MKLKKLDLFGFKTFPEPTELVFHDGITSIVGPNGCGKSNVIDAIRWVMGETSAKGLRGDSMEDVIFSGSDSRKALNLAEVTLTLSEVEGRLPDKFGAYHEVAVTRRLHRSGESEYLINKIPCRLRDITELFMDTGVGRRAYSVVEQGRIDAILSAKPRDRRFLIEEAAGITKYKSRKDETVRKMEQTGQNLQRLNDVLGEVRREMNALKRQASRATAFKELRTEKRGLERDLLVVAWLDLQMRIDAARTTLREREDAAVQARTQADGMAARLEQGRLQLIEEERELERLQAGVYHLKNQISQRESRLEFLDKDAESLAARTARAAAELAELGGREEALGAELQGLREELAAVAGRVSERAAAGDQLQRQYQDAVAARDAAEIALEQAKRALLTVLGEITRTNHGLDHAFRQRQDLTRRLEGMGRQQAEVAATLVALGEELAAREQEHRDAQAAQQRAGEDRTELGSAVEAARLRRSEQAARVEETRKALHTDQSRLRGLEEIKDSLEWYGAGVQAILRQAKNGGPNGVRGVVADTITAPAPYEVALEAALGERLQYVIVEDAGRGLQAVEHLKTERAGRSSFAPLALRRSSGVRLPETAASWAHGPLLDLVEVAPEYQGLANCLLGDVFVVESLDHALTLWQQNGIQATLVTLDGETVSAEGIISGGRERSDAEGLLQKNRRIRELRAQVKSRAAALAAEETQLLQAESEFQGLAERLEAARDEVHRRELQVLTIAKDLTRLRERFERLEERREAMDFETEDLASGGAELDRELARLEEEKAALAEAHRAAEARVEALESALAEAREQARSLHDVVTREKVAEAEDRQRSEGLGRQIRSLETSLENVARRREALAGEGEECSRLRKQRVAEHQQVAREAEVLRGELGQQEQRTGETASRLDGSRSARTEEERAAAQARRGAEEARQACSDAQLALQGVELQAETLAQRFRERLSADLAEQARAGVPEGFDPQQAQERVADLEGRLAGFGEINLLAIDAYEERRARYEFLEAQKTDLEESLAALRQAISRINRVSRERFEETFGRVSEMFQSLYPKLFRGGEARLVLTEPEDLLETGIDIIARPPGKRPQHISLLSGGEKALTAVALIFSIFLVKPSPFCILDEVDAPLDEANIGRFTELLKELSSASQFLLITHNKSTMESADHLYGVTMAEPGISKVVSVRLADARPARAA